MPSTSALHHFLDAAAEAYPQHIAVEHPGVASITYEQLRWRSDALRRQLGDLGIAPGDRVGIYMPKSIEAIVAIFGILKAGAAYVPVDAGAPLSRNAYILNDCAVKAIVAADQLHTSDFMEKSDVSTILLATGDDRPPTAARQAGAIKPSSADHRPPPADEALAYILYTSGSTGKPKGVALSHRAAISFVNWCSEVFTPGAEDRFSSHAPFHFDLSILDIYVPIKHGATIVLIDESLGKDPLRLAPFIAENCISCWYSTPSILTFLAAYGNMERYDYRLLRHVLFAGEVFPIKHLQRVKSHLPHARFFNLYGPTETNVCTYYEIPAEIPAERVQPFPIGKACSHYDARVVDPTRAEQGALANVPPGCEGELVVHGAGVMNGYWNLPERTAAAFLIDEQGRRWYKTGDIVVEEDNGVYTFVGRRDRMVKKRGYRVELGEIEAGLYRHPRVKEVAVIALKDKDDAVTIRACISYGGDGKPSLIELKQFCRQVLPAYMVPDSFSFHDVLPKTSTDKIDYQALVRLSAPARP